MKKLTTTNMSTVLANWLAGTGSYARTDIMVCCATDYDVKDLQLKAFTAGVLIDVSTYLTNFIQIKFINVIS